MRIAASSPVWLTRRAEERKDCCSGVSGRMGFPPVVWDWSGGEAWGCDWEGGGCGADVLWKREGRWRDVERKSRHCIERARGIRCIGNRGGRSAEDILDGYCTIRKRE